MRIRGMPRWLSLTLVLTLAHAGATACSDPTTPPSPGRPMLGRSGPGVPDVRGATLRVLSIRDLGTLGAPHGDRSSAYRINDAGQVIGVSGGGMGGSVEGGDWEEVNSSENLHSFLWEAGRMIDINARAGATSILATGIANDGTVVLAGMWRAFFRERDRSFLWNSRTGSLVVIVDHAGAAGCVWMTPTDVNDALLVSARALCRDSTPRSALRMGVRPPGGPWIVPSEQPVAADGAEIWPGGYAVNDAGDVVGASAGRTTGHPVMPTLWLRSSYTRVVLDCQPACRVGGARAVNDRRWIVGTAWYPSVGGHEVVGAFLWTIPGGFERIEPLPGDDQSAAYGINERNQVVGYSWSRGGQPRAFVWTRRGGTQPLGTLPGAPGSKAYGINERGQVVGSSGEYMYHYEHPGSWAASDSATRAVLWQLASWQLSPAAEETIVLTGLGNLRISVLGATGVDPMQIDVGSLRLGDEVGQDTPPALDAKGNPLSSSRDVNGDGVADLVVEFPIPALVKSGDVTKETAELRLTGATYQGIPVDGTVKVTVAW